MLIFRQEVAVMVLKNAFVLTGDSIIKTDLVIEKGIIAHIGQTGLDGIDYSGYTIVPGFVDTHIHGAYGSEFSAPDGEFDQGLIALAKQGTTAVCATIRTLEINDIKKAIKNIVKEYKRNPKGARIEGIHLEGPFVSSKYIGAMEPKWLIPPSADIIKELYDISEGLLKIITVAPELEGATEAIKAACNLGIKISLGHTGADYATSLAACEAGATRLTHTFNAVSPFHHRFPGVLGFCLTDSRMECEAICDFVHLDPATVKLIYLAKGEDKITMVSDAGVFAGLGDGEYIVAGRVRTVKNGVCLNDEGKIAGSCFTIYKGVKNLLDSGYDIKIVSKMASFNPARAIGIDGFTGTIEVGKVADLVVLDGNWSVCATYVRGTSYE